MTQTFFIPGTLPNLNDMIAAAKVRKGKWSAYAVMKQEQENYIIGVIRQRKIRAVVRPVTISFTWWERDERRDFDNICAAKKFICDALVTSGIMSNDGRKQILGFSDRVYVNPDNPGVVVKIQDDAVWEAAGITYVGTSAHAEPV